MQKEPEDNKSCATSHSRTVLNPETASRYAENLQSSSWGEWSFQSLEQPLGIALILNTFDWSRDIDIRIL